jgi:chromosome segregation ATPase
LYAAQKEIEVKRQEAFYRQKELEKRKQELEIVRACQKELDDKYARLSKELEEKKEKESGDRESEKKDLDRVRSHQKESEDKHTHLSKELEQQRKTYTAFWNYSNAQNSKMSSGFKYLDSITQGVELANRIGQFISSFQ